MNLLMMIILVTVGFLSIVPVINMNKVQEENKYKCLKYLVNVAFIWTIVVLLERLVTNTQVIYYLHMAGYPIKFALTAFMVCTIFDYIEKHMPKWIIVGLGVIGIIELILAFTNASTKFFLDLSPSEVTDLASLYNAESGSLFIYHLVLIYIILLLAIYYLFYFLYKHREIRHYRSISRTMGISVFVVLFFNISQLLFIEVDVDLTYISLVLVSGSLYQVIFKKDMIYNLKVSGRGEILSNMRELYILTDDTKSVVEISSLLIEKYQLNKSHYIGKPWSFLEEELLKEIVIYRDYDMEDVTASSKDHYHLREKKFELNGFKEFGYMYLLYDETQVYSLLRELNRLSNYDHMTGLNNRNYMEKKLENLSDQKNIGVISLDLNGLKANNDYLGHERGDYLLKRLASFIKITLETVENKYVARIGGDEFLVIIENTTEDTLNNLKIKLLELSNNKDIEKRVSVSIGTAFSEKAISIYKLIQEADADMYKMKSKTSAAYSLKVVEYAKKSGKYIR